MKTSQVFLSLSVFFLLSFTQNSTGYASPELQDGIEPPSSQDAQGLDVGKYYFWHNEWKGYLPLDPPTKISSSVTELSASERGELLRACTNRRDFCHGYYYGFSSYDLVLGCSTDSELQEFLDRRSYTYSTANEIGGGLYTAAGEAIPRAYKTARNALMWVVYQSGGWAVHAYNWSAEQISNARESSSSQIYSDTKSALWSAKNYIASLASLAEAYVVNNALRRIAEAKGRRVPRVEEELWVAAKARLYCLAAGENTRDLVFLGASLYGGGYLLKKTFGAAKSISKARTSKSGVKAKPVESGSLEKGAIKWLAKDFLFSKLGPLTPFLNFYKAARRYWRKGKDLSNAKEKGGILSSATGGFARVKKSGKVKIYGDRIAAAGKSFGSVFATEQAVRGALRDPVPEDIEEVTEWLDQVREQVETENGDLQNKAIESEEDYLEFENLMP